MVKGVLRNGEPKSGSCKMVRGDALDVDKWPGPFDEVVWARHAERTTNKIVVAETAERRYRY
jgi:hypothetical protein